MKIRRMIALGLAMLALGTAALGEATMEELRAIRKSAEDGIAAIEAPTLPPEPTPTPEATPEPTPVPEYPVLEQGAKGDSVKAMQERLIALGYLSGGADGNFGPMTRQAVTKFQEAGDLPATGIADQDTQAALYAAAPEESIQYEALKYDRAVSEAEGMKDARVTFAGTVMQALTAEGEDPRGVYTVLRVAMRQHAYDVVFVTLFRPADAPALAEGDSVRVRGVYRGQTEYESVSGGSVTLPWVEADAVEPAAE